VSSPAAHRTVVVPAPLTLADLRARPVSGHLQRVKRQSGDRWRAKWRDAANVEHLKVLGRVLIRRGRAPGLSEPRGSDCCFRTHALLARCEPRRARLVQTQV